MVIHFFETENKSLELDLRGEIRFCDTMIILSCMAKWRTQHASEATVQKKRQSFENVKQTSRMLENICILCHDENLAWDEHRRAFPSWFCVKNEGSQNENEKHSDFLPATLES